MLKIGLLGASRIAVDAIIAPSKKTLGFVLKALQQAPNHGQFVMPNNTPFLLLIAAIKVFVTTL